MNHNNNPGTAAISRQIELHNNGIRWFKFLIPSASCISLLFYLSLQARSVLFAWIWGILLVLAVLACLILGFALWKSQQQIHSRLENLQKAAKQAAKNSWNS